MRVALIICFLFFAAIVGCGVDQDSYVSQDQAVKTDNITLCKKSDNPDICYYAVGRANHNKEACTMIKDATLKLSCNEVAYSSRSSGDNSVEEGAVVLEPTINEDPDNMCEDDFDCPAECDLHKVWDRKCNKRTGQCLRTTSYDCKQDLEVVEGVEVGMTCFDGQCVSDEEEIANI